MSISIFKSNLMDLRNDAKRNMLFVRLGILSAVSLLFAVSGPFGTFQAGDFANRLLYWFVLTGVSVLIAFNVKHLTLRHFPQWSILGKEGLCGLAMTLLFTPFLWVWTISMFPGLIVAPPSIFWLAGCVLIICVSISVLLYGLPYVMKYANSETFADPNFARILRRLPDGFSGKIIRLAVQDHIVHLVTDAGRFQLRMRFADAVDEAADIDGVCTHRSHWVVVREIEKVGTVNGRPCLTLSNGDEVPVSRKYQPNLEALGIL